MTKNLTEQWKKGELEEGAYYVKLESGKIDIYFMVYDDDCDEIVEVLAPVPSYEEYSRLEWYAGCGPDRIVELNKENRQLRKWCEEFNALDVTKENAKLKELLKECRETIEKAQKNYGYDDSIVEILEPVTNKIDEALQ